MSASMINLPPASLFGLAILSLMLQSGAVLGGDWKLSADKQLDTKLVFTDNRRLDQSNESDTVIDLRPGISLSREGARMKVDLEYDLAVAHSLSGDQGTRLSNFLDATLHSELYENAWFVDASAGADLLGVSGLSSLNSDGIYDDANSTQAFTFSVSPYSRHHLGRYLDILSRTTIDYVDAQDGAVSESAGLDFVLTLQSGRYFSRLPWSVSFRGSRTERQDRTDKSNELVAQTNYRINRQWGVFGRLGLENNDVQTTREDTDGLIWALGGSWTPNPRTSVDLEFGQRYFGNNASFSLSHRTRRTRLTASYARTVSNARSVVQESLTGYLFTSDGQPIVNSVTGEQISQDFLIPRLIDDDFVQDAVRVAATLSGKRNSVSLQTNWSSRIYEVSAEEEDSLGVTLSFSHALTQRTNGTARLSWQQTEPNTGQDRSTYLAELGVSRRLGRLSSVNLDISHRQQDDANGTAFDENRVSAGFSTQLW